MYSRTEKHVRFLNVAPLLHAEPVSNLSPYRINIPFDKTYLSLWIEAAPVEVDALDRILSNLNTLSITPNTLNSEVIQVFIAHMQELLELSCMSPHQECIKTNIRHFFLHLIHQMPNHFIQPGYPGYRQHIKELEKIDALLTEINHELRKINAISTHAPLSLQNPADMMTFNFFGLPKNLSEFMLSIKNLDEAPKQWKRYFQTHTPEALSHYLGQVTQSIQHVSDHNKIDGILKKINAFIEYLDKEKYALQISMFNDMITHGDRSPLRASFNKMYEKDLKEQLNQFLDQDGTDFNDAFATFRQALATISDVPKMNRQDLSKILTTLARHLRDKTLLPVPPQHIETLQAYIDQSQDRIRHPLPDELRSTFNSLRLQYEERHNLPFSPRKHHKYTFLTTLENNIRIYPQKTYTECYNLTFEQADREQQALFTENRCIMFFGKHRFKNFIADLLQEEPDYDALYPCSEAYLNRLQQDSDAGAHPC